MDIHVEFSLDQPVVAVWAALQDVPAVISCVPGLELTGQTESTYHTNLTVKLGPVAANFAGESYISTTSVTDRTGCIEGKGVDKGGGTTVTYKTTYRLIETPTGTQVNVDANIRLTGTLARMSRIGIFQDVAEQLAKQFGEELGLQLQTSDHESVDQNYQVTPTTSSGVNALTVLFTVIKHRIARLFESIFARSTN